MANKSKKKRKHTQRSDDRERSQSFDEDQRSVAVTVAWMMSALATVAALILDAAVYALTRMLTMNPGQPSPFAALPGVLLFMALITGTLALGLIPLVYYLRGVPPPLMVTIGSACIGAAPWVVLLF